LNYWSELFAGAKMSKMSRRRMIPTAPKGMKRPHYETSLRMHASRRAQTTGEFGRRGNPNVTLNHETSSQQLKSGNQPTLQAHVTRLATNNFSRPTTENIQNYETWNTQYKLPSLQMKASVLLSKPLVSNRKHSQIDVIRPDDVQERQWNDRFQVSNDDC
jgi:hypothetical protein